MGFRVLWVIFLVLGMGLWGYSGLWRSGVFKGEVFGVEGGGEGGGGWVWVKTNQGLRLSGKILYVYNEEGETKGILKVIEIRPKYIKTEWIDGDREGVRKGDQVRDVYEWDGFEYKVELVYGDEDVEVGVMDFLMVDRVFEGEGVRDVGVGEVLDIDLREGIIEGFELKGGEVLKGIWKGLDAFEKLRGRKVRLRGIGGEGLELGWLDLRRIRLLKRVRGGLKFRHLHYAVGDSALVSKVGVGKYRVIFRFLNHELGLKVLEGKIAREEDEGMRKEWIENLKIYGEGRIKGVGIAGSFNSWDESRNMMEKNDEGIYEAVVDLEGEGKYQYYFVILFEGKLGGREELIKLYVVDPYSNRTEKRMEGMVGRPFPGQESGGEGVGGGIKEEGGGGEEVSVLDVSDFDFRWLEKVEEGLRGEEVKILEKKKYYKVKFQFNRLDQIEKELKKVIEKELSKRNGDQKKLENYKYLLSKYSEEKIRGIYVTGSFSGGEWLKFPLKRNELGVWETKLFVPEGSHWYKYVIDIDLEGGCEKYCMFFVMRGMRGSDGGIEDKNGAMIELDMGVKVGSMLGGME